MEHRIRVYVRNEEDRFSVNPMCSCGWQGCEFDCDEDGAIDFATLAAEVAEHDADLASPNPVLRSLLRQ